jgi:hypothetical protein
MKFLKNTLLKKAPHFFILTVAIALTACSPATEKEGLEGAPNFILIYTDEMQFSDLG